jgi:tetratricopeptide (TPR) repeat protein
MRAFPNVGNDLRRQFLANLSTSAPLKSYVKDRAAKANALAVTEAAARASAQAAAQAATEKDRRDFDAAVRSYRAATLKPSLPEQARKYKVQAEDAINEKDFNAADGLFRKALAIAPWWPEGHFNLALVLGETGDPSGAIVEMKRYLSLVPNAPDARDAQDKIYAWERKTE